MSHCQLQNGGGGHHKSIQIVVYMTYALCSKTSKGHMIALCEEQIDI